MKKWFILQVWRVQQVASVLTLGLLVINLSLQVYALSKWREGIFANSYTGVPVFILIIVAVVWGFSIFWDLKMKMWREQASVNAEKTPYSKEKMTPKECLYFQSIYIPLMEHIAEDNDEMRCHLELIGKWVKKAKANDPVMVRDLKILKEHIMESEE